MGAERGGSISVWCLAGSLQWYSRLREGVREGRVRRSPGSIELCSSPAFSTPPEMGGLLAWVVLEGGQGFKL